jgi:hypothetical protein
LYSLSKKEPEPEHGMLRAGSHSAKKNRRLLLFFNERLLKNAGHIKAVPAGGYQSLLRNSIRGFNQLKKA